MRGCGKKESCENEDRDRERHRQKHVDGGLREKETLERDRNKREKNMREKFSQI